MVGRAAAASAATGESAAATGAAPIQITDHNVEEHLLGTRATFIMVGGGWGGEGPKHTCSMMAYFPLNPFFFHFVTVRFIPYLVLWIPVRAFCCCWRCFVIAAIIVAAAVAAVIVVVSVSPHCFLLSLGHVAIYHLQRPIYEHIKQPNVSRVDVLIA